jgi:hypothetical protein
MLVALLPEQISEFWPLLKGHIDDTLPPTGDYGSYDVNKILYNLLFGYAQLWLYNEGEVNKGFIVTTIYDDISGVRSLIIYSMVVIDKTAKVDWQGEFETLRKYANSRGCSKVCSFVRNDKIVKALKEYGIDTQFTFIYTNI